ncbi:MAG: acyltransferase family protein [Bacteroidetes bacterium]|nr:acyltransferase family protein [Bacteroidota bacterium]
MEKALGKVLHFSGLNGLRAIAAIAVLFSHTTQRLTDFGLDSYIFGTRTDGKPASTLLAQFGVTIFFVLSGFLITYLLLQEKQYGEINIRHFYVRRILRIWPLYYLYLVLSLLTCLIFNVTFGIDILLFYVFLMANIPFILGTTFPFLGHYWSLGVEEQFYSFWPWVVKKRQDLLRTTVLLAVFIFSLKCCFKFYDLYLCNGEVHLPYLAVHVTRFHCMLMGAVAAILFFQRNELFLRLTNSLPMQMLALGIIFLAAINKFHVASFIDNELISLVAVVLIIGQVQKVNRVVNLENHLFDQIGKVSYGIYVFHPLIIYYLSKIISFNNASSPSNYFMVYLSVLISTLIVAFISYHFFEIKFLRLKGKYSAIKSSGTVG